MPPAYKRLNKDDCVFLFVDHQVSYLLSLDQHSLVIDLKKDWPHPASPRFRAE